MRRLLLLALTACGTSTDTPADPTPDTDGLVPLATECQKVDSGYGPAGTVDIDVEVIAEGLEIPWSIAWLPDGAILVTERTGDLVRLEDGGRGARSVVASIVADDSGEGGLLGMALHPDFATNRWVYLYVTRTDGGQRNVVERWTMSEDLTSATLESTILPDIPALRFHNGGRLRFGPDGHLYVGTGDAGSPSLSADPTSLAGKLLRVTDEGEAPADNPIPGEAAWLIGLRNTQGFDWRDDGRIVITDHGPSGLPAENGRSGHDEISIAEPADNLGWPEDYKCQQSGSNVAPAMTWADAMPPGGTAIYSGTEIGEFAGDVFIGVLGFGDAIGHLHRIRLTDDGNVTLSETYLRGEYGRLREVVMGPDGGLYVTTSGCDDRGTCPSGGDRILRIGR